MRMTMHASALSALSAHRFLLRAALAATVVFAWIFVLQFFYLQYASLSDAFVHTIVLYALTQLVTLLLSPYSAAQLSKGVRRRMIAGLFAAIFALLLLGAAFSEIVPPIFGLLCFALFLGVYRAFYWTPYVLEKETIVSRVSFPQEIFLAFMPAIAGLALYDGILGATVLLFAGVCVILASVAPLAKVPEFHEKFTWRYRQTFAELFEAKYNALVETSFIEGIQGAALFLIWPMAMFIIVGLSYTTLGLVITATLLLTVLIRPRAAAYLDRRPFWHAALAASGWLMRLVVATPLAVVIVDASSSAGNRPRDIFTLDQSADNGTYLDEYTVLKEIAQSLGRICICLMTALCIATFSLPIGLAAAFVLAAAVSIVGILSNQRKEQVLA